MASLRPTFRAQFTDSPRATLPICLRFILDGLGNFRIHSGTVDPDCNKTFAILLWLRTQNMDLLLCSRFQIRCIFVGEERSSFAFAPSTPSSTYFMLAARRMRKGWLTYPVNVALHACREIIIDNLAYTLKIHASGHDFCRNHNPTLTLSHAMNSILSLLVCHSSMQTIHVWYAVQN